MPGSVNHFMRALGSQTVHGIIYRRAGMPGETNGHSECVVPLLQGLGSNKEGKGITRRRGYCKDECVHCEQSSS